MDIDVNSYMEMLQKLATTYAIRILGVFVLLIVAKIVATWVKGMAARALERADIEAVLVRFFSNLASTGIFIIAIISALGVFGVETTSFAARTAAWRSKARSRISPRASCC